MQDPLAEFQEAVRSLVDEAVRARAPDAKLPLELPHGGQADLAAACFTLAKPLRKPPAAIAQEVAQEIAARIRPGGLIERVEAAGGYLNFFVDRKRLAARILPAVLADGERFGTLPETGKTLILEHTSANPNGPLHVGRARNPIIGDTLVRIQRRAGWKVDAQYYVDDIGKQVAILAWGLRNLQESELPDAERDKADHRLVRFYQVANQRMEQDEKVADGIQLLVQHSETADKDTLRQFEDAYGPVLEGMLSSLARIGVQFDSFVKESSFVENQSTADVTQRLSLLAQSRRETDGALHLDLSEFGIHGRSQRFVYRRSDGTSLYATRDVAYHFWKANAADRLINVLGEDHKLQAQQVRISLELLGCKNLPEVIFYAFVSLPEGKMSTRRGRVVYLDDLVDEAVDLAYEEVKKRRGGELDETRMREIAEAVGVGALRYNIVRVQPEKGITFKWEEALNFEGASAPFLQYSYARCASILRKASVHPPANPPDVALLAHASELGLLHEMARLPRVVEDAALRDAPHSVATYAQELAGALNAFYRDCPVLTAAPDALRLARLQLVEAARTVLKVTLDLLGVQTLEEM